MTFVLATLLAVLSPAIHLLLLLLDLAFDRRRWRFTRFGGLGLAFCVVEAFGLFALFTTWVGSGFGLWAHRPLWVRAHTLLVRQWLGLITRAIRFYLGFGFSCTHEDESPGSQLILSRHAGPGDALLIARIVVRDGGRGLRMLGTAKMQWDPFFDILGERLGFHYTTLKPHDPQAELAAVTHMADALGPTDALVIFPEGGNFTPHRRRSQLGRFVDRQKADELERARALEHTLLPKAGGVAAALDGGPDNVLFAGHAGLEDLFSMADLWRAVPLRREVRAHVWPANTPPPDSYEARCRWLYDEWAEVDAWVHDALTTDREPPTSEDQLGSQAHGDQRVE